MKTFSMLLTVVCFFICKWSFAQSFSTNPLEAKFVTEDVDRFWQAFDQMDEKGVAAFQTYIDEGSAGLNGFLPYRIISADSLYAMVRRRPDDYLASKKVLDDLDSKRKRIQAIYAAMKYWYADAVFPPIYFVVGRFNSGGTVSEEGIILGTEMQKDLEGLPALVAHELIHYQQDIEGEFSLLLQTIVEGSADFIGELISGEAIQSDYFRYGEAHETALQKEFVQLMHDEDLTNWLYGTNGKDDRPNDLGYWMGYKITAAYFEQQKDKREAIQNILTFEDPYVFLAQSGYLKDFTNTPQAEINAKRPKVIGIEPFENGSENVDPTTTTIQIHFDQPLLGKGSSFEQSEDETATAPEFKGLTYSADRKTVLLEVGLEPNTIYELIMTGRAFKSAEGYSMKDYVLRFKTQ